MTNQIIIKNLCYSTDSKILYEDLNYEFTEGTYNLIGDNGVGKTTLLNLIVSKTNKYEGSINRVGSISYISQEEYLFENISVRENICVLSKDFKKTTHILEQVVDFSLDKKISKLSGGEKQIIKLIIGLFEKSDIYLIDEPFNNLDKDKVKLISAIISSLSGVIIIVDHQDKIKGKRLYLKQRKLMNEII